MRSARHLLIVLCSLVAVGCLVLCISLPRGWPIVGFEAALGLSGMSFLAGGTVSTYLAALRPARENDVMAHPAVNLDELSPEEQFQLQEDIWDRLSEHPSGVPLSDRHRAELDRRLDALAENVRAGRLVGRSWSEVRGRLQAQ